MTGPAATVLVSGRAPISHQLAEAVVRDVLRRTGRRAAVSLRFVGRDRIRTMHREYKGSARTTDVLAFALPAPDGSLAGDVYVCPWTARRAARRHRVPLREELIRYIVHGVLHVVGYDHPEGEERMGSPMWRLQERCVAAWR